MPGKQYLLKVIQKINHHADKFPVPYLTFAVFGIITYPFYYFLWHYTATKGYENLSLRLVVVVLCLLLAFKNYWPKKYLLFLPTFWYFTLLYSLPFLFTYLLLKNNMSYDWSMNTITVLILSILLLDLVALLIILSLGISLGILFFKLNGGEFILPAQYVTILITYSSVLFFGAVFSYRKDELKERQRRLTAEAANVAKSEFISNMGHDLITPFAGIRGSAELLYSIYAESDPVIKEWLEEMINSCGQWEAVHHRILDSINIADNALSDEQFSIKEEIKKIAELMAAALKLKNLHFSIQSDLHSDLITTDRSKLNFILLNLISNAINFTTEGEIIASIEKENSFFKIHIKDTGIGIPDDKFEYIFEQFTKLSPSNKYGANFKGLGAGLYISKKYLTCLGGKIQVISQLGMGSTFTLILPMKRLKA